MKDSDIKLGLIIRSSKRLILLSAIGAFLSLFDLDVCNIRNVDPTLHISSQRCTFLIFYVCNIRNVTFAISEKCSVGSLPTVEEILKGMLDPYALPGPCGGSNAIKLWLSQATISISTALLGLVLVMCNLVTLQEREQPIIFIARNSDPPDLTSFSQRMQRARRQAMCLNTIIELVITVLPHPASGLKQTLKSRLYNVSGNMSSKS